MTKYLQPLLASAALLVAMQASATTITFDELTPGVTLSSQYETLFGVSFTPNVFTGAATSVDDWATNTDMTIVSSTAGEPSVSDLGLPLLVSGNVLHRFGTFLTDGWNDEDGVPNFSVSFDSPIDTFSADFAGVSTASDVRLFVYNGADLLGTVAGSSTDQQFTLSYGAASITSVVITPGSVDDWVAVDNISFTLAPAIPEPGTYALMGLGLAALALARRRARAAG